MVCTENGFGKQTKLEEFSKIRRSGQGVIAIQTSERNGAVVGACQVLPEDQIMLISDGGTLVRTAVNGISTVGRNTQGVTLIRLSDKEHLVSIAKVVSLDGEEEIEGVVVDDAGTDVDETVASDSSESPESPESPEEA